MAAVVLLVMIVSKLAFLERIVVVCVLMNDLQTTLMIINITIRED